MKFLRNLLVLFAVLQLATSLQAWGGWRGGWGGWGGWGPSRGAFAADVAIGGATNIIGGALTADAINKSQPGYWEYRAERERRRAEDNQARRDSRRQYYGYQDWY